jgi:hypothetical protein
MTRPSWTQLTQPEVTGRIGLAENDYGVTVTVFVCSSCGSVFTVTGDIDPDSWGTGCLAETCDSYDVSRDVGLMFDIEPWRVGREDGA